MTRILECLKNAKLLLQEGLESRRWATDELGDNSRTAVDECRDILDRIINEDGAWRDVG